MVQLPPTAPSRDALGLQRRKQAGRPRHGFPQPTGTCPLFYCPFTHDHTLSGRPEHAEEGDLYAHVAPPHRCRAHRRPRHRARRSARAGAAEIVPIATCQTLSDFNTVYKLDHRYGQLRRLPVRRKRQDHHRPARPLHRLDVPCVQGRGHHRQLRPGPPSTSSPSRTAPSKGTMPGSPCAESTRVSVLGVTTKNHGLQWRLRRSSKPRQSSEFSGNGVRHRGRGLAPRSNRATRTTTGPSDRSPTATTACSR